MSFEALCPPRAQVQTLGTDSLPCGSPSQESRRLCPLPVTSTRKPHLPPWQIRCPDESGCHACGSSVASSSRPPTHSLHALCSPLLPAVSGPVSRSRMRPQLVHSQKGPQVLSEICLQVLGFLVVPPPCPSLLSRHPCLLPSLARISPLAVPVKRPLPRLWRLRPSAHYVQPNQKVPRLSPSLLSSLLPPFLHFLQVTCSLHQQVVSLSRKANPTSTGSPDAPCEQRPCAADASKHACLESQRPGAPSTEQATGSLTDQTEHPCSDGLPQTAPSPTLPGSVSDHLPRGPQRTPRSCLQSWGEAASQPTASRVFPTLHSSGNPCSNPTMCSCDIKNGIRSSLVAPQLRIGLASKGTWAQPESGD